MVCQQGENTNKTGLTERVFKTGGPDEMRSATPFRGPTASLGLNPGAILR
jgi:hypothetical protein